MIFKLLTIILISRMLLFCSLSLTQWKSKGDIITQAAYWNTHFQDVKFFARLCWKSKGDINHWLKLLTEKRISRMLNFLLVFVESPKEISLIQAAYCNTHFQDVYFWLVFFESPKEISIKLLTEIHISQDIICLLVFIESSKESDFQAAYSNSHFLDSKMLIFVRLLWKFKGD